MFESLQFTPSAVNHSGKIVISLVINHLFPLRSRPLLRCSAATAPWFQTDTALATTLSQTTSSFLCPVSARAHRHAQQNLSSAWCRDSWTWGICAINATPAPNRASKERLRRWRRTHKRKQTASTKQRRDRLTRPTISKRSHRSWWRRQTRLLWRPKLRLHHKERRRIWSMRGNHKKMSAAVIMVVVQF